MIAVAPRLFAGLVGEEAAAPIGERIWGEAALLAPEELRGEYTDAMTGDNHVVGERLPLARLLGRFPVALLVRS